MAEARRARRTVGAVPGLTASLVPAAVARGAAGGTTQALTLPELRDRQGLHSVRVQTGGVASQPRSSVRFVHTCTLSLE